jgi:hypothetical protein
MAEIPGATCAAGIVAHGGKVSVPLLDVNNVTLTACLTSTVASVGAGTYSSA